MLISSAIFALFLQSQINGIDLTDLAVFCVKREAVVCEGHKGRALTFAEVSKIDAAFRPTFKWADPDAKERTNVGHVGDCMDYALILSEKLAAAGEDGTDMALVFMVQCDPRDSPQCDAHARLWVQTSDRGVVEVDTMHAPGVAWNDGVYFGFMREDGNQVLQPMPGYHVSLTGIDRDDQ